MPRNTALVQGRRRDIDTHFRQNTDKLLSIMNINNLAMVTLLVCPKCCGGMRDVFDRMTLIA